MVMSTNYNKGYQWGIDPEDPMIVQIYHNDKTILRLWIGEIIENSSRTQILNHIKECDDTPWLEKWQKEKYQEVIKILTK